MYNNLIFIKITKKTVPIIKPHIYDKERMLNYDSFPLLLLPSLSF